MSDQWATPGSQTSQPSASRPTFSQLSSQDPTDSAADLPRPLPMRPQSLIEVLDAGFALVRSAPVLLFSIVAVFHVPLAVLSAYLRRGSLGFDNQFLLGDPTVAGQGFGSAVASSALSFVAGSLIQTIAGVAIGLVVTSWYSDRDPDVVGVLASVGKRLHWIVLAWLMVHLLEVVALVGFVVGSLLIAVLFVVVGPVMAVEGVGPVTAIKRSVRLVRGRYGSALSFFLLSGLIASVLGSVLGGLPTVLGLVLGVNGGWILVAVGTMISGIMSTAFLAAATVAFYFDLRVRREGIDLHLAMVDRFPR